MRSTPPSVESVVSVTLGKMTKEGSSTSHNPLMLTPGGGGGATFPKKRSSVRGHRHHKFYDTRSNSLAYSWNIVYDKL